MRQWPGLLGRVRAGAAWRDQRLPQLRVPSQLRGAPEVMVPAGALYRALHDDLTGALTSGTWQVSATDAIAAGRVEWRPPRWCATGLVTGEASCRAATA